MEKTIRITTITEAKKAEKFIFAALKPGGFAHNKDMAIPSLKDELAWLSWANLMRPEQPSFIVKEDDEIVAGIFGEPVEQTFDIGESEIQRVIFKPNYETKKLAFQLLSKIVGFYQKNSAKQVHFWVLEKDFNKNKFTLWQKVAIDSFGFAFKGFRRISKWSGKLICKIEKCF